MSRLIKWWSWIWLWLTRVEPVYQPVTAGSRDRTLRGKARRNARKEARRG